MPNPFKAGDRVQYGTKLSNDSFRADCEKKPKDNQGTVREIKGDMTVVDWDSGKAGVLGVHHASLIPLES